MTPRARLAVAIIALLVLVAVAYAPVQHGVFVWDDHTLVAANRAMATRPWTDAFVQPFWTNDPLLDAKPAYYRPLVALSYRVDLALASDDAASFHLTNLGLHLLATALLVSLARRLGATTTGAVIAGAVWALAPRLTESVAWVSGRTDVLAGIGVFAALLSWPWLPSPEPRSERPIMGAAAAAIALLFALLAKEVAIAGAAAIAMGTWIEARRAELPRRALAQRLAWVAAPIVVYALMRARAMQAITTRATPLGAPLRAETAFESIGRYATMVLDPFHPSSSIGLIGEPSVVHAAIGGILSVALLLVVWRALGRRSTRAPSAWMVGATLAVAALAPVVHVFPIGLAAAVVADRLLYLPLAGIALAIAVAASRLRGRRALVAALAGGALAAAFVPVVSARALDYTDELRFRVAAAENAHPRNTSPLSGLATVLRGYREHVLACRLHDAVRASLEKTGRTGTARHGRALENAAGCLAIFGKWDEAAALYETLATANPTSGRIRMEIGFLALHRMDFDLADSELRRAVELEPALEAARATRAQIPKLRARAAHFATPEAQAEDRPSWARLLATLGRRSDALAAWDIVLHDPSATQKGSSMLFLLEEADWDDLTVSVSVWRPNATQDELNALEPLVRARTRQHESVVALRPRIERLLAR